MNCREARRLLSQGVAPGSASADRAALGFHLAGCPSCRAYRATLQEYLLADLLAASPAPTPAARRAASAPTGRQGLHTSPKHRSTHTSLGTLLWYAGMSVLATIVLVALIVVAGPLGSFVHIHQNVQAMIVPPPAPAGGIRAGPAAPMATIAPGPTARPSATPPPPTRPQPSATPKPTSAPPTVTPTPTSPPAGGPITVLLLGSDRRPGESGPSRTDAIIIARIDPQRHRIALLSLPRDLWVEIPGYGHTRINAANVWGAVYGGPNRGLPLARETVSNLLGIPIDYTIFVDFEGFIGAIDSLGGITVDVPKELYDPQFPTMDYGYTVAHFPTGPQHMDGATALTYSRIRHADSDFGRMRRQQAVLAGILGQLREQNALESIKSIEAVTTALRDYVKTDIPEDRLIGLTWALRDMAPDQVEHYVLDETMISFGVGDDHYAEVAQPGAIEEVVGELLGQRSK